MWIFFILIMKKIILFLLFTNFIFSQARIDSLNLSKNNFYVEFFGNSYGLLSGNYERLFNFKKTERLHLTTRIGVGFGSRIIDSIPSYNFPVELNLLIGKRINFAEIGFGWTGTYGKEVTNTKLNPPVHFDRFESILYLKLGYRLMKWPKVIFRCNVL